MRFDIVTIFPGYFASPLSEALVGKDVEAGSVLGAADPAGPDGPGVYFEMRYQGRPEDPLDWLRRP